MFRTPLLPVTLRITPHEAWLPGTALRLGAFGTRVFLRACLRALLPMVLLAATKLAWAQQPPGITVGELAILPVYCPYTQTFAHDPRGANPTPNSAKWAQTLGKSFWGLHHYCWALVHLHRAKTAGMPRAARQHHWSGAINDLNYVIQNSTSDFVLLPEIYQRMGETYLLMGSPSSAVLAFTQSREQKPDYWPPYVAWADALVKLGKKSEAKAHLEDGLRRMPTTAQLLAAYQRLGGDADRFLKSLPPARPASVASNPDSPGKPDAALATPPQPPAPTASTPAG